MTYLVIGNNPKNQQKRVLEMISKSWGNEVTFDLFEFKHPDIHILDGIDKNSIGIEEVKGLQNEMMFTPFEEKTQIAVINRAERLTLQAQNSILKTLEESSDTTIFFLLVNNERSLLPTIISRCQKIYTKDEKEIQNSSEDIKNLLSMNLVDVFKYIESISKEKSNIEILLKELELYLQVLLEEDIQNGNEYKKVAKKVDLVHTAQRRIKANGNKKLVLENLFLHLREDF